jgi:hypothetical protein
MQLLNSFILNRNCLAILVDDYREGLRRADNLVLMIEKERERRAKLKARKEHRAATKMQAVYR